MKAHRQKPTAILLFSAFSIFITQSAFGGGVVGWTATDGFNTVPVAKNDLVLDIRFNATFPGKTFLQTFNIVYGLSDFMEVGVGTGLNFASPLSATSASIETVYPWLRVYVPFKPDSIAKVRFGFMVGTLIPAWRSSTPAQPGVSGLLDIKLKNGTFGFNGGYAHSFPESSNPEVPAPIGSNIVSGNVNHSMSFEKFSIYEEAFINHSINGDPNGGFRVSMYFPFLDNKIIFDLNPAVLWMKGGSETEWFFSPNAGLTFTF